jgi:RNA polymerase sigma factor (sigma-70 family)
MSQLADFSTHLSALAPLQQHDASARVRLRASQAFFDAYWPTFLAWARRWSRSPADAQELAQEAFAHLLECLPAYEPRPGSRFRAWLRVVVHNLFVDLYRREANWRRFRTGVDLDLLPSPAVPDEALSSLRAAIGADALDRAAACEELLRQAAINVGKRQVDAFRRREFGDRPPYAVIAEEYGVATDTVRTWCFRVRRELEKLRPQANREATS